jgi:hypothetical protein
MYWELFAEENVWTQGRRIEKKTNKIFTERLHNFTVHKHIKMIKSRGVK